MVTIADVARHAGVSPKTVSNVLNGYRYLRPETKERVERAIRELGYTVNLAARGLRRGRTGMVTLAVPDLRDPYLAELSGEVIHAAEREGGRVLVTQTDGQREREIDVLHGPNRHFTDGTILSPQALGPEDVEQYEVDFPLVLLGERVDPPGLDRVTLPNVAAARALTAYVLGLGCRRVVLLGCAPGTDHGSAPLREQGFREAHAELGVEVDDRLLLSESTWRLPQGAQRMNAFIDSGTPFDAVVAMNDALAVGALHSFRAHDIPVPDAVKVVGIDNIEDASFTSPTLTSLSVDHREFAREAIRLLLTRIDEHHRDPDLPRRPKELIQPAFRIEVRQSTGGIPVDDGVLGGPETDSNGIDGQMTSS
ncbi:LacI family DNA-binding transcriptional regulator [Actinomyces ruminis]|uniref:LacI family transcriptional regulator n=1 Tax=Actinomyces ruminis TaxID=1937003 RepID=A0ABX4MF10_9ACTO|nr:LacI family DNA-binding transcriptional regulator [Actinomyces ruminis]PHP53763.1 LacI family transcriptional regulator [Actinomyces ruminis]